jgi:hypothetical protein
MWNEHLRRTPIPFPSVTSPEEQRTLTDLTALLSRDLSTVPREELAAGVRAAEQTLATAQEWSGRLIAAMLADGATLPEVVEMTGVSKTTAHRRAQRFA